MGASPVYRRGNTAITPALLAGSLWLLVATETYIPARPANLVAHTGSETDRAPIGVGLGESADPRVEPSRLQRGSCLPAMGFSVDKRGLCVTVARSEVLKDY